MQQILLNNKAFAQEHPMHTIRISFLVVIIMILVMFPRIATAMGAPVITNFLHFFFVPALFLVGITRNKFTESFNLIVYLSIFLMTIILSALINNAGLMNIVLDFLLLAEPFMLLSLIVRYQWSPKGIRTFRSCLLIIAFIHILIAYYQIVVLGFRSDDVEGLFIGMGAGSHLAGAVAVAAALLLSSVQTWPIWIRVLGIFVYCFIAIASDSKQVIAVFFASLLLIAIIRATEYKKVVKYFSLTAAVITAVYISAHTVFPAFRTWLHMDLLIEGIVQKFSVFPIVVSYYDSSLNILFGLGPGHTVGRLGTLVSHYFWILEPLGITTSPATSAVWNANQAHYISNSVTGSSIFSLLFSWAGLWGDIGVIGLVVYLFIWAHIWKHFCTDDYSKYLLLTILVFGAVFSWMEEPGYMLFVIAIIGLRWQENRNCVAPTDNQGRRRLYSWGARRFRKRRI